MLESKMRKWEGKCRAKDVRKWEGKCRAKDVRNVGESGLPLQHWKERNRVRLRVAKEGMIPPPLLL